MKILAVPPLYPPYSRVGAWLATHSLLSFAAAQGHRVVVAPFMHQAHSMFFEGVELAKFVDVDWHAADADVVLGHCGDSGEAGEIAARHGLLLVQMFHGFPAAPNPDAALIVFNSEASKTATGTEQSSIVCHPWTDPAAHRGSTGDRVTIVNCSKAKGIEMAHRLSIGFPDLDFVGVLGGYGDQLRPPTPNFEIVAITDNMRSVWARTRILIMPSRAEAWGMVGVEAFASGIPVIASDLPGLRESLGDAGIFVAPDDEVGWARELRRLQDPDEWAAASARALQRSAELEADDPRPKFLEALAEVVA